MVYDIEEARRAHGIFDDGCELGAARWIRELGQVDNCQVRILHCRTEISLSCIRRASDLQSALVSGAGT